MGRLAVLAVAGCTCWLAGARTLNGGQALSLQVSPAMVPAPAFVSVRALVEANDANRALEIVAESPEFFRSSRIDLEGRNAPRLLVFEFKSLPAGEYTVSGVLIGTSGTRATASRLVKVVPMAGSGR